MKASILQSPGVFTYEEVEIPEISADDVLIQAAYVGICGSDLPRANAENGARMYPLILGHEFSGTVVKIGKNVKNVKIGDEVAVAPLVYDPNSHYSKEGLYGLSDNAYIIGTGCDGAMAEYVKVPQEHAILLPENLDLITAAGVEPAAISWHAVEKANMKANDTVAVLGMGPIGQFAVQIAKIFGARKVIAVDIFDDKLELAKELGADYVINSRNVDLKLAIQQIEELGVDIVLETAGNSITQKQAIHITRKNGRIVLVGLSHQELSLSVEEVEQILRSELSITGSWNSYTAPFPGSAWQGTLDQMSKGNIKFKEMITHNISLKEVGDYLPKMYSRELAFNKVLIDIRKDMS